MRLTDIVIASLVLGAALGFLTSGQPSASTSEASVRTAAERAAPERMTWLRTPMMRRTSAL
jgi:hypothetical protein